ncbi:hypothetical protein B0H11DRAFT_1938716 [Mycena galericulata]|nr:hypothetical protein B0H11DRAFT_1938716 [Mycena galericulata]
MHEPACIIAQEADVRGCVDFAIISKVYKTSSWGGVHLEMEVNVAVEGGRGQSGLSKRRVKYMHQWRNHGPAFGRDGEHRQYLRGSRPTFFPGVREWMDEYGETRTIRYLDNFVGREGVHAPGGKEIRRGLCTAQNLQEHRRSGRDEFLITDEINNMPVEENGQRYFAAALPLQHAAAICAAVCGSQVCGTCSTGVSRGD